jgi:hypothetical protein
VQSSLMKQSTIMTVILSSLFPIMILAGCATPPSTPAEFAGTPPAIVQTEPRIVTFPDENLAAAIRESLGKPVDEEILFTELAQLTESKAWDAGITDLSGIEYCTNLSVLGFWRNPISDVSPVSSLTNLTILCLQGNDVSGTSPLASLTNLIDLHLTQNQVSDISPLLANSGLGEGDSVLLGGNGLDLSQGSEDMENIRVLESRGVLVSLDPQQWAPENASPGTPVPVPIE